MKFKFSLETVLKHRTRLEEAAQRDFAEAQAAVDACLRKLEEMYAQLDQTRDSIAAMQNGKGAHNLEHIRSMETFIGGHKIRIDHVRVEARELLTVAEEKQELLMIAAREKKVLVQLKDKKIAEHRELLNQLDAKATDDMNNMRQSWGKR